MKYRLWMAACSLWPFWGVHRDATEATGPYLNKYRVGGLVLASSLALLFGLGVRSASADAWGKCGSSTFPATGQTTSHPPMLKITDAPVRDDGVVQAGGALRYQNNGDGTITDLNTGLMWEQKIRDIVTARGNHDVTLTFAWDSAAPTIWDWLEQVNTEGGTGLAGHNDWRIPNVKELQSIVDYGTFSPPVDVAFNHNPGMLATCSVAECSLTVSSSVYWSATTMPNLPAFAWYVFFGNGSVDTFNKSNTAFVRAVRGGCVP